MAQARMRPSSFPFHLEMKDSVRATASAGGKRGRAHGDSSSVTHSPRMTRMPAS